MAVVIERKRKSRVDGPITPKQQNLSRLPRHVRITGRRNAVGKMLLLLALVLVPTDRVEAQIPRGIDSVATRRLTVFSGDAGAQAPVFTPQPTRRCCSK